MTNELAGVVRSPGQMALRRRRYFRSKHEQRCKGQGFGKAKGVHLNFV